MSLVLEEKLPKVLQGQVSSVYNSYVRRKRFKNWYFAIFSVLIKFSKKKKPKNPSCYSVLYKEVHQGNESSEPPPWTPQRSSLRRPVPFRMSLRHQSNSFPWQMRLKLRGIQRCPQLEASGRGGLSGTSLSWLSTIPCTPGLTGLTPIHGDCKDC